MPPTVAVVYGTSEGQTAKIADRIVERVSSRGHAARAVDASAIPPDFDVATADAVVVASSIHRGKHQRSIERFVREHRDRLSSVPTGFVQVSLSSALDDEDAQAEAASYVEAFLQATDWHPDRIGRFGGALRFSRYGFLTRLLMKRIARDATGVTDPSRDYEYTDWDEVDAFADEFAAFVEGRLGIVPPGANDVEPPGAAADPATGDDE